mmetsp:Transcript_19302/g.73991  ORF Transcript_19302/g.73991 Transcript_19302/m.73991 type:complete len:555 (+) Transcript_19302:691-2355(+)
MAQDARMGLARAVGLGRFARVWRHGLASGDWHSERGPTKPPSLHGSRLERRQAGEDRDQVRPALSLRKRNGCHWNPLRTRRHSPRLSRAGRRGQGKRGHGPVRVCAAFEHEHLEHAGGGGVSLGVRLLLRKAQAPQPRPRSRGPARTNQQVPKQVLSPGRVCLGRVRGAHARGRTVARPQGKQLAGRSGSSAIHACAAGAGPVSLARCLVAHAAAPRRGRLPFQPSPGQALPALQAHAGRAGATCTLQARAAGRRAARVARLVRGRGGLSRRPRRVGEKQRQKVCPPGVASTQHSARVAERRDCALGLEAADERRLAPVVRRHQLRRRLPSFSAQPLEAPAAAAVAAWGRWPVKAGGRPVVVACLVVRDGVGGRSASAGNAEAGRGAVSDRQLEHSQPAQGRPDRKRGVRADGTGGREGVQPTQRCGARATCRGVSRRLEERCCAVTHQVKRKSLNKLSHDGRRAMRRNGSLNGTERPPNNTRCAVCSAPGSRACAGPGSSSSLCSSAAGSATTCATGSTTGRACRGGETKARPVNRPRAGGRGGHSRGGAGGG